MLLKKFVATSNRLFFYDLSIIFVGGKRGHYYLRSIFKKSRLVALLFSQLDVFYLNLA